MLRAGHGSGAGTQQSVRLIRQLSLQTESMGRPVVTHVIRFVFACTLFLLYKSETERTGSETNGKKSQGVKQVKWSTTGRGTREFQNLLSHGRRQSEYLVVVASLAAAVLRDEDTVQKSGREGFS